MNEEIIKAIAAELKISEASVNATLSLLEEGGTVPFIARYRKEQTGGLDEEQILYIQKQYDYQIKLADRKEAVLKSIAEQDKLTDEIKAEIEACTKLSQVEDLYRPYVQKKKTRAATAIKKGLQPLADWLLSLPQEGDLEEEASKYITEEVKSTKEALQGARDIIAEVVSDDAKQRWSFKEYIEKTGSLTTKLKKDAVDEKNVFEMYYDRSELLSNVKDHRIMAIDRGEKKKILTVSITFDEEHLEDRALEKLLKGQKTVAEDQLREAAKDGCERMLFPSIEREIRSERSQKAEAGSIELFSMNLEKLLLQPPLKGRTVLGFDPGFANGCKLAVIDETGKMLTVDKVFPFARDNASQEKKDSMAATAMDKVANLIRKYEVQIIAIGNGTASRESEKLIADMIREKELEVEYAIVSEAGASVWSAQEEAKKEFPDVPIEERSAVSIGRRLLDPLAELIKIDPKSIGVGQYQHDVSQSELSNRLDEVVMKCVNRTGADLNTASLDLLTHISGLNKASAQEIINYRNLNGRFTNRQQLLKVKKIGPKAYTLCAGFLRITDGDEPLDQTSIHPESYDKARKLMEACGIEKLGQPDAQFPEEKTKDLGIDPYTLKDIEDAIRQPLRDYRDQFEGALLRKDIMDISDLHAGDQLTGTVRNVVDFGAFVDIGVDRDGLVHTTRMSMSRVNHPSEVVSVGDIVQVYVVSVDEARNRIDLSFLPLEKLAQKEADEKARRSGSHKGKNKNRKKSEPEVKKEISMDDAMARLMQRFGRSK